LYVGVGLVFAVNREDVDIASEYYRLNGQAVVPVQGNVTIKGLSVGIHSSSVKATDVLENAIATQTVTFTVGKPERFPLMWFALAIIASAAVVSFGLVTLTPYGAKGKAVKHENYRSWLSR
jgi:hypothetical protein